jgi:hypothetical protein
MMTPFEYKGRKIQIIRKDAVYSGDIELVAETYSFTIDGADETIRALPTWEDAEETAKRTVDEWLS